MRNLVFAVSSMFLSLFAVGQVPVQQGEKVQFIDENGKVVNQGMFKRATQFSDGLAAVDMANEGFPPKWTFITPQYRLAFPHGYDTVGLFHQGICPAKKNGNWFYIGKDGFLAFEGYYSFATNFSDGYARVSSGTDTFLINDKGERASPSFLQDVSWVVDSLYGGKPKGSDFWMLLHLNGDTLLTDSFYSVQPGDDGIICVNRLGGYRFLTKQGKLLFGKAFLEAAPFRNGFASVRLEDGWRLMDAKGQLKKDVRLLAPVILRDDLTPVLNYNGTFGILGPGAKWIYRTF